MSVLLMEYPYLGKENEYSTAQMLARIAQRQIGTTQLRIPHIKVTRTIHHKTYKEFMKPPYNLRGIAKLSLGMTGFYRAGMRSR